MITGPVVEMLARNVKFAKGYTAPPPLMQMANAMRSSGAGVVVISCSDPRLNPYQILGIDGQTVSELASLRRMLYIGEQMLIFWVCTEATMVRNAGGRVFDAIRTLSVLQTIGNPGTIV